MKTRPIDLAELARADREHSIFAPSSGGQWALCAGSLIASLISQRKAGRPAAEGAVAHGIAHNWIKEDWWYPKHLLGITYTVEGHKIEVDEEMLDAIQEYVVRCKVEEGVHFNEQRVDISYVTPIPNQGGTADYAVVDGRTLKIIDFKFGRKRISAAWNVQLMLYAIGRFLDLDVLYDFETIELVIVQPRIGNYDSWTCSRTQLIEFMGYIRERARLAWRIDAPRTPGAVQCEYCPESGHCMAQAAWLDRINEQDFENLEMEVTSEQMVEKKAELDVFGVSPMVMPDYTKLSEEDMSALLPYRDMVEAFFKGMEDKACEIAMSDEEAIEGHRVVERRKHMKWSVTQQYLFNRLDAFGIDALELLSAKLASPNQVMTLIKKKKLPKDVTVEAMSVVSSMAERPKGEPELVPSNDPRPTYAKEIDVDSVMGDDDL